MRCSLTAIRLQAPFRHLLAVVVRVRRQALLKSRLLTVGASAVGRCHLFRPPDAAELVRPRARLRRAAELACPHDPLRARTALVRHPDPLRALAASVRHPDLFRCPRVAVLPHVPLDRTCPSRIRLTDPFVASPLKVGFQRQLIMRDLAARAERRDAFVIPGHRLVFESVGGLRPHFQARGIIQNVDQRPR